MPRHLTHHGGMVYVLPVDFPQRLKRFQKESGLSWEEWPAALGHLPTPFGAGMKQGCAQFFGT